MGYGGALIWTGLARNLKARYPNKKVVFVQPRSLRQILARKPYTNRTVYMHNPDIDLLTDQVRWLWQRWTYPKGRLVVNMADRRYQYWTYQDTARIDYIRGRHAIAHACAAHGIFDPQLRPRLQLTREEKRRADELLAAHGLAPGKYIALEPHTKESFTPNKAWFWERWQAMVNRLDTHIHAQGIDYQLVQVGAGGKPVLNGVLNLTGSLTFRETGRVLERAALFVCCVGGLLHASRAMGTRNVVLISGFESPELAGYPGDVNLHVDMDCQCFGLKTPCPLGREAMRRISVDQVFAAVTAVLKQNI